MNSSIIETELTKLPRPTRNKSTLTPRIMHFGPGAFFRSFVASLIDEVNEKSVEKWGIIAVSLKSKTTFDKLVMQDFVFNSLAVSSLSKEVQQISSISDFLVAQKNSQAVLDVLSDEKLEIVSLTITEKGYYYNSEKRELDFTNQKIVDDFSNIKNPQTVIGFIVAGLRERYLNSKRPFTILSCDNLPNNGAIVKKVILDLHKK